MTTKDSPQEDSLINNSKDFNDWFSNSRFEEYKPIFVAQGFVDLNTIAGISSKDELDEIGICLLGKKLMLMSKIQELKTTLSNNVRTITEALIPGKKRKQSSKISKLLNLVYFLSSMCFQVFFIFKQPSCGMPMAMLLI